VKKRDGPITLNHKWGGTNDTIVCAACLSQDKMHDWGRVGKGAWKKKGRNHVPHPCDGGGASFKKISRDGNTLAKGTQIKGGKNSAGRGSQREVKKKD